MRGLAECKQCRQLLPADEFDVNMSAGRRRLRECKVCRHQRLARSHEREANKLLAARHRRRDREQEHVASARTAAGRD
jgi:hypothetical protein